MMPKKNSNHIVKNSLKYDIYNDACNPKCFFHNAALLIGLEQLLIDHASVETL